MQVDHLFSGNALAAVDHTGRLVLPSFVRSALERRSDGRSILIGPHEFYPCLTGYARNYAPVLFAEVERRRLRDEAAGAGPELHHVRAHRLFGAPEEASYQASGRVELPPLMRRRGRIQDLALFVGAGGTFEIWNPDVARAVGDEDLRELAAFRLEQLSPHLTAS